MTYSHPNGATPMSTHVEAIPQVANVVTCDRFMRSGYLHLCQYWPASAQYRHITGKHQTQYRHSTGISPYHSPVSHQTTDDDIYSVAFRVCTIYDYFWLPAPSF